MAFTFDELDVRTTLPEVPARLQVVALAAPCVFDRTRAIEGLTREFGFEARTIIEVPFGYAVGGNAGQVEVFAASGAVRARSTEQLSRYPDERRPWAAVEKENTDDGAVYRLSDAAAERLINSARGTLDSVGLAEDHARVTVALEQWAQLDEKGTVLESGPSRATVRLAYEAEGLPLIGAGAKTNVHYDPDGAGEGGVLARFFHVHRKAEGARDVETLSLDRAFRPLLSATWSGFKVDPGTAKLAITSATFGLLALPADRPQRYAAPALMVEGRVEGAVGQDGREMELRFGRYLPLTDARTLAAAGYASTGPVIPGIEVPGRPRTGEEGRPR